MLGPPGTITPDIIFSATILDDARLPYFIGRDLFDSFCIKAIEDATAGAAYWMES